MGYRGGTTMKKALSIGLVVIAVVAGAYAYTSGRLGGVASVGQTGGNELSEMAELLAGTLQLEGTQR
jgi:hypothetical protein